MDCMIGVERTAIRSKPNARNSSTDKGDAGRNIVVAIARSDEWQVKTSGRSGQRRQDAAERLNLPVQPECCCLYRECSFSRAGSRGRVEVSFGALPDNIDGVLR